MFLFNGFIGNTPLLFHSHLTSEESAQNVISHVEKKTFWQIGFQDLQKQDGNRGHLEKLTLQVLNNLETRNNFAFVAKTLFLYTQFRM